MGLSVLTGPQEWVWQEMKAIADMRFKFQEEEDAMEVATRLASTMHLHAPEHILVAETLHEDWDPVLVSKQLFVEALRLPHINAWPPLLSIAGLACFGKVGGWCRAFQSVFDCI